MSVVNISSVQPTVWIPPAYTANWRIVIVRNDGTQDDVTDIIDTCTITDAVTDGIGSFSVSFWNPNEDYTGVYTGMEQFLYYCEYSAGTPATLRFRGRVEKPSTQNNKVLLTGRSESLFLADRTVTETFTTKDVADILRTLIDNYGGGRFTYANVPSSTGITLTVDWRQKPFLECIKAICSVSGYDWHVNAANDNHFFAKGSVTNVDDAVVHSNNLFEVGEFATDSAQVRNLVRVYGANNNGVQVLYTAKDAASQATYGIKELIVQDSNLDRYDAAKEYGDYLLSENLNPPQQGDVKSFILATVVAGESIIISAPYDGLYSQYYPIVKVVHSITQSDISTTCTINREPRRLFEVIKKRVEAESRQQDANDNPNGMEYSLSNFFDVSDGTHSNTEVAGGALALSLGQSYGQWTSVIQELSSNVTQAFLNVDAEQSSGAAYEVSGNGGVTWLAITPKTLLNMDASSGTKLSFRITLSNSSTSIKGFSLLYKTA